jgi:hypothetical protein
MRDKIIALILEAQGYKESGEVSEYWQAVYRAEMESRRKKAGKIADALLKKGRVVDGKVTPAGRVVRFFVLWECAPEEE